MSWIPNTKPMVLTLQQEFYGTTDSSVPSLNANTVVTGTEGVHLFGDPVRRGADVESVGQFRGQRPGI